MAGDKAKYSVELYEDQHAFLEEMTKKHDLEDVSKALRCLINYASEDGDEAEIFEEIRCLHCG